MKHPPELEESYRKRSRVSQPEEYCVHQPRPSNEPMQRPWDTRTFNHDATSSPSIYDLEVLARKMKDLQGLCADNGCHRLEGTLPCPASRNQVVHSSSSNLLNTCTAHAQQQQFGHARPGNGNLNFGAPPPAPLEPLGLNHIGAATVAAGHNILDAGRYAFPGFPSLHDDVQPYLVNLPQAEAAAAAAGVSTATIMHHYGHNHRSTASTAEPRASSSSDNAAASAAAAAAAAASASSEHACKCCELNNAEMRELFNQDCYDKLMQELYFLTNRVRREDDLSDIVAEWKFAAIVIDRACLIVFSTFAVLSLAGCLSYAPHLIV